MMAFYLFWLLRSSELDIYCADQGRLQDSVKKHDFRRMMP
jgi:hypothetical protein